MRGIPLKSQRWIPDRGVAPYRGRGDPQFGCKRSPMAPWIRRAVSDIGGGKADIEINAQTSAVTSSLIYIRAGWGAISRSPPVAKC